MLHGSYQDGTRYWGEQQTNAAVGRMLEAVELPNLPAAGVDVVFAGCCWGALVVEVPAATASPGKSPAPRIPERSLALSLLQRGARAFVGCTGEHYSPRDPPYDYFGGPIHRVFWEQSRSGAAPAVALFEAKRAYRLGMPHGQGLTMSQAIEFKMWRQFTCLGLGW
jgi:hypothetical protein